MYTSYNVVGIGLLFLLIYATYDVVKNKGQHLVRRIIFYSFILYSLFVIQLTTDGIIIPPQKDGGYGTASFQFIPFSFVGEWIEYYNANGMDWRLLNSVKLSFFNLVMLFPLGAYLTVLFGIEKLKRAITVIFLATLIIESYQVLFGYLGLIRPRTFNVDDLILNSLGGIIGFLISRSALKTIKKIRLNTKDNS